MTGRSRTLLLVLGGLLALLGIGALVFGGFGAPAPELGRMFTASGVGQDGCPAQTTAEFRSDDTIFVGLERSRIPRDTAIFARLIAGGRPLEDSTTLRSDRDFVGCVWFEFAPARFAGGFAPGNYSAEIFVNGARVGALPVRVEASSSAVTELAIGPFYSTAEVDQNGCPERALAYFRPEDAIYISAETSQIPAGTEIFVRLIFAGNPIEDTAPLVADQDLTTCVWFVFERTRAGGFAPGDYQAEVYVNGERFETVRFTVE